MIRPVILLLAIAVGVGCATHADRLKEIRSEYHSGHLSRAEAKIDAAMIKQSREADVLKLDKATTLLCEGKPREAETLFREVCAGFDSKEGKDIRESALSMVTDDQRLAYPGEDYEKVLLRFYLSLCNLLHDGSDASAYALQVNEKQQQIIQAAAGSGPEGKNPKDSYKLVAAGAYLYAAIREETHTNYDDVARALEQVAKWQPDYPAIQADLQRAKTGHHSQKGHGVVYVFTMVGRGPYKEERVEPVSTVSVLVADRLLSALGRQTLPPNIAPIKVPRVVRQVSSVQAVSVGVDGKPVGQTQTITDVSKMAMEQCDAVLAETIARAVVRRIVKKGIVYGAKEAAGVVKNGYASLALDILGVAWEATESADTRCWGLLPDKIQVLRLELPIGVHQVTLQPTGANTIVGGGDSISVAVEDGRNSYVVAHYPGGKLVGNVLTNRPGK